MRALTDLRHVRNVASEFRRPAEANALASEVITGVEAYEAAVEAFLAGEFDAGNELIKQAHIGWRQMQTRHGIAKYV